MSLNMLTRHADYGELVHMGRQQEVQDDVAVKKQEDAAPSFGTTSESRSDFTQAKDDARPKSLSDSFRDSYNRMHQEIYSDLYRNVLGQAGNDWRKPPLSFPTAQIDTKSQEANKKPGLPPGVDAKLPPASDTNKPGQEKKPEIAPPPKPKEKPEQSPKSDTKPESLPTPEYTNSGKVTRDGNRVHVDYPDGKKMRDIVLDSSGKAQEIITKDPTGTMHLLRRNDRWVARIQGMELQMPGKIEANDRGEVTFELEQGIFRREKPDGTSVQEKTNADGSFMSFYPNNQVEKLTRKDGSSIQVSGDGKTMIETLPGSNRSISWSKNEDGTWKSDGQPPQIKKNFKVESNGTTSWDGPEGLKFAVRSDGAIMVQGEGQAKIQLDEQNRIKSIDYGKKVREFEYFDNSTEIKKTVIKDQEKGSTNTFTREQSGSDRWKTDNGQTWTGDIKVGPGGVYSYKPSGNSITSADKDGRWYTMWPDGSTTRDTLGEDGSRLSYDNGGKLRKAHAKDGTSADINDSKIAINNPRSGERITWTKEGDSWKSDSPRFPGSKKDLQINEKCEISFTADDGSRHAIRPDGKEVISKKDGVQLELNDEQQIDRIRKGDSIRSIGRGPDGSITRIVDQSKDSEKLVLERKANDGINSVGISKDGDILIKRNDNSSTLERADFTSVTRDKDGSPLQVSKQRGDTRTFKYTGDGASKTLSEIQETKRTSKGDLSETWTRKPGTDDFVTIGKNGKEKVRPGVQVNPDGSGDYTYKSKEGKDIVARLGSDGGDSALSESVEEARENLLDELRDKLPEANLKRFQEMMQSFEKRMGDRAYLRKIAGVKGSEAIDEEVQKTVQGTYDNLRQMVSKGDEGAFYDQKTRVKLAENFMFHAMEPSTIDQGPASSDDWNGHGTCWISSGQIWGMTQHPGAMADYLKQVSLNGQVTTKNSGQGDASPKTYTFSTKLLTFSGNKQENKWTIESATQKWKDEPGMRRQIDGDRSPVSKIFDYTLPMLAGSRREFDVDGGLFETANLVGQGHTRGTQDIMYMVTGDAPCDKGERGYSDGHLLDNNFYKSMAEKGTVLNYSPGHLRSMTVRKVDDKWYLLQDDQHGELEDKVVAEITDIEKWVKGDRSAQRSVNMSTMDLLHKKKYVGSGDSDAIGNITPRKVVETPGTNNSKQQNNNYQPRNYSRYNLPPVEINN